MHFLFHFHHILYSTSVQTTKNLFPFCLSQRLLLQHSYSSQLLDSHSARSRTERKFFMCNGLPGIIIFTKGFTSITCTDFQKNSSTKEHREVEKGRESMEKYSWIFNELSERRKSFFEIANFKHYAVLLSRELKKKSCTSCMRWTEQVGNGCINGILRIVFCQFFKWK